MIVYCTLYELGSKFIVVPTIIIHSVSIDSTSFMVCPNITVVFMKSVLIVIIAIIIFDLVYSVYYVSHCNNFPGTMFLEGRNRAKQQSEHKKGVRAYA